MSEFTVSFSYPDGHVAELEETFSTLEKAKEAAENMLNQVRITESLKKTGVGSRRGKPFYFIYEIGDMRELVCESEH